VYQRLYIGGRDVGYHGLYGDAGIDGAQAARRSLSFGRLIAEVSLVIEQLGGHIGGLNRVAVGQRESAHSRAGQESCLRAAQ
jgi:hypothetical protein